MPRKRFGGCAFDALDILKKVLTYRTRVGGTGGNWFKPKARDGEDDANPSKATTRAASWATSRRSAAGAPENPREEFPCVSKSRNLQNGFGVPLLSRKKVKMIGQKGVASKNGHPHKGNLQKLAFFLWLSF